MKNIIVKIAFLILNTSFANNLIQENNIPNQIAFRFHYQFPGAKEVIWEKKDLNFIATYLESGLKVSVFYDKKGNCTEIDREIYLNELPIIYSQFLTNKLDNNYQISKITSIDDFSGNPYFLIEILEKDLRYYYELTGIEKDEIFLSDLRQGTVVW